MNTEHIHTFEHTHTHKHRTWTTGNIYLFFFVCSYSEVEYIAREYYILVIHYYYSYVFSIHLCTALLWVNVISIILNKFEQIRNERTIYVCNTWKSTIHMAWKNASNDEREKRIDYPARTISLLGFKGATELHIQQVFDLYYH